MVMIRKVNDDEDEDDEEDDVLTEVGVPRNDCNDDFMLGSM